MEIREMTVTATAMEQQPQIKIRDFFKPKRRVVAEVAGICIMYFRKSIDRRSCVSVESKLRRLIRWRGKWNRR